MKIASSVPFGMDFCGSAKSPEMLAPANMPVAAGKNIENTEKKSCVEPDALSFR